MLGAVPNRRAVPLVAAVLLHLAVGVPYLTVELVAPRTAALVLQAGWVVLLVVLVMVWRRWPWRAALVPVVALVVLIGVVSLGGAVLGWTA